MNKKLLTATMNAITPILSKMELELWDMEIKKEGGSLVLRAYVDKADGGVGIDELSEVSRELSDELDRTFTDEVSYILEVSSPGVERSLKKQSDFLRYIGEKIDVALFAPMEGKKKFTGNLVSISEDFLVLKVDEEEKEFPRDKIAKANLHFEFK